MIEKKILKIRSNKELELINITQEIRKIVGLFKIKEGIVILFSRHTTLALKINEDEKLLRKDMDNFLKEMVYSERDYFHDNIALRKNCSKSEPKNARGHLQNLFLETSQLIPLSNGKMALGRYQEIFAIETSGPREREITVQVIGE